MTSNFTRFFPKFAMSHLFQQHSGRWAELVDHISGQPHCSPQRIAFTLTMRRLRQDLTGRGFHRHSSDVCTVCAMELMEDFNGDEQELLALYYANLDEVKATMKHMRRRAVKHQRYVA